MEPNEQIKLFQLFSNFNKDFKDLMCTHVKEFESCLHFKVSPVKIQASDNILRLYICTDTYIHA